MSDLSLTIDGTECFFDEGETVLQVALESGVYIPSLCHHPDLPPPDKAQRLDAIFRGELRLDAAPSRAETDGGSPESEVTDAEGGAEATHAAGGGCVPGDGAAPAWDGAEPVDGRAQTAAPWEGRWTGCGLCLVEVTGMDDPVRACCTTARDAMEVITDSEQVRELRRRNLAAILEGHPHACLTCAEREGCTRITCSLNVPVDERCCSLLGKCELQKVADYVGIPEYTSKFTHRALPILDDEPLYRVNYNLCIACGRCVRACTDLREVGALGAVEIKGRTVVGHTVQGGLQASECRFCGACVEVCPTGALTDKKEGSGAREGWLVPCRSTCPAGVDVPQYIRLIGQGRYEEATEVVRRRALLPLSLGSACFHPCETACRRAELDEPVAICDLKRFAAERGLAPRYEPSPTPTGKKVAVVGSGPAGLSCAWYLSRKGHAVEVLEAGGEAGGMMTQAIPDFRLPKKTVLSEIERLVKGGVTIKTSSPLREGESPEAMLKKGFDAVFLAVGNAESKRISLPGEDGPGVYWGLDLLRDVKAGARPAIGDRVIVVGGGNVAVDAALTAVRLGAREVHMVCLEKRAEMPAHPPELEAAIAEGVVLHNSWGPSEIVRENGNVRELRFVRCTQVFAESGAFNPTFDDNETRAIEGDSVILAIGQVLGARFAGPSLLNATGRVAADPATCATKVTGLYAGGEASRGPLSIIEAVRDGRKAAAAIDVFLGGDGVLEDQTARVAPSAIGRDQGFARRKRVAPAPASARTAATDFSQIAGVFTEEQARLEAGRCLQCDLRLQLSPVVLPPASETTLALDESHVASLPEAPGVYRLFDGRGEVLQIRGAPNLKEALRAELGKARESARFQYEEEPMYTRRESELIQQYVQQHGVMPGRGGEDDLDDLF